MTTEDSIAASTEYGCDELGRLRRVLLHRPERGLERITAANCHEWLFDAVPDIPRFLEEHDAYRALLESLGVEVLELSDYVRGGRERTDGLPNLTYLHDTAVVSRRGAIVSAMSSAARRGEEQVVREALVTLGVPILLELTRPDDAFEGCLLLDPRLLLVADTERHTRATIQRFIPRALEHFPEVLSVEIPKARRYMHPDTIYNRIGCNLALAYLPAFRRTVLHTRGRCEEVDFRGFMARRGVELVEVSDAEQARLACSFVPLEPNVIVHLDWSLSPETRRRLGRKGVELILLHTDAMRAGGGSLRCLTLRLHRGVSR